MNDHILREYHRNMLLASTFSSDTRANRSCLTMGFARDIPSSSLSHTISALIAMYEPVDDRSQGIAQNVRKVGAMQSESLDSRAMQSDSLGSSARVTVI